TRPRKHMIAAVAVHRIREASTRYVELPVRRYASRTPGLRVLDTAAPVVRPRQIAEPPHHLAESILRPDAECCPVARAVDAVEREPRPIAHHEGPAAGALLPRG